MKWYWIVSCDNTVANPFVADTGDLKGFDRDDLTCGRRVEGWNPEAWVRASRSEDDGDPDDALQTHLALPIYSRRLRGALGEASILGIQYLPIETIRPDGSHFGGFAIANILSVQPALDFERSDYELFPNDYFLPQRRGKVRCLKTAVLRASRLKEHDILRLAEYDEDIYVSERFKIVFETGGFTGYSFHERDLS